MKVLGLFYSLTVRVSFSRKRQIVLCFETKENVSIRLAFVRNKQSIKLVSN